MGRILCIANQKGGVGKTTTAINLARALALSGKATLLVDLDPQGNALLGIKGMGEEDSDHAWLHHLCPRLDALSFPLLLQKEHMGTPSAPAVKASLDLQEGWEWALLDCPPRMDAWGLAGLETCHSILIPVQTEFFAMQGLTQMLRVVENVKATRNPSVKVAGILLTMLDWREPLHLDVVAELHGHLGSQVFETMIPRDMHLAEAASHGRPVWEYDPSCPGSLAYLRLAREVIHRDS